MAQATLTKDKSVNIQDNVDMLYIKDVNRFNQELGKTLNSLGVLGKVYDRTEKNKGNFSSDKSVKKDERFGIEWDKDGNVTYGGNIGWRMGEINKLDSATKSKFKEDDKQFFAKVGTGPDGWLTMNQRAYDIPVPTKDKPFTLEQDRMYAEYTLDEEGNKTPRKVQCFNEEKTAVVDRQYTLKGIYDTKAEFFQETAPSFIPLNEKDSGLYAHLLQYYSSTPAQLQAYLKDFGNVGLESEINPNKLPVTIDWTDKKNPTFTVEGNETGYKLADYLKNAVIAFQSVNAGAQLAANGVIGAKTREALELDLSMHTTLNKDMAVVNQYIGEDIDHDTRMMNLAIKLMPIDLIDPKIKAGLRKAFEDDFKRDAALNDGLSACLAKLAELKLVPTDWEAKLKASPPTLVLDEKTKNLIIAASTLYVTDKASAPATIDKAVKDAGETLTAESLLTALSPSTELKAQPKVEEQKTVSVLEIAARTGNRAPSSIEGFAQTQKAAKNMETYINAYNALESAKKKLEAAETALKAAPEDATKKAELETAKKEVETTQSAFTKAEKSFNYMCDHWGVGLSMTGAEIKEVFNYLLKNSSDSEQLLKLIAASFATVGNGNVCLRNWKLAATKLQGQFPEGEQFTSADAYKAFVYKDEGNKELRLAGTKSGFELKGAIEKNYKIDVGEKTVEAPLIPGKIAGEKPKVEDYYTGLLAKPPASLSDQEKGILAIWEVAHEKNPMTLLIPFELCKNTEGTAFDPAKTLNMLESMTGLKTDFASIEKNQMIQDLASLKVNGAQLGIETVKTMSTTPVTITDKDGKVVPDLKSVPLYSTSAVLETSGFANTDTYSKSLNSQAVIASPKFDETLGKLSKEKEKVDMLETKLATFHRLKEDAETGDSRLKTAIELNIVVEKKADESTKGFQKVTINGTKRDVKLTDEGMALAKENKLNPKEVINGALNDKPGGNTLAAGLFFDAKYTATYDEKYAKPYLTFLKEKGFANENGEPTNLVTATTTYQALINKATWADIANIKKIGEEVFGKAWTTPEQAIFSCPPAKIKEVYAVFEGKNAQEIATLKGQMKITGTELYSVESVTAWLAANAQKNKQDAKTDHGIKEGLNAATTYDSTQFEAVWTALTASKVYTNKQNEEVDISTIKSDFESRFEGATGDNKTISQTELEKQFKKYLNEKGINETAVMGNRIITSDT